MGEYKKDITPLLKLCLFYIKPLKFSQSIDEM